MRTLIIDNYDSFTFNLFHHIAEVTGVTPVVVRNDEPGWTTAELLGFDSVVISPGPGRPERAEDFGICAQVIAETTRPLLGVCLGHQGICSVFGGQIQPAPEPVHGRQSPVVHQQVDILAGLPSPFPAVRYHSLAATSLPEQLEAIAWTPDGILMAVRHRDRPMWGVQFHPESICTEQGRRILANFAELTDRWHAARADGVPPGSSRPLAVPRTVRPVAAVGPPAHPPRPPRVLHRRLQLNVSAELAFGTLYSGSDYSFWLDSSLPDPACGRFSFMGDARGPLARIALADAWEGRVTVRSASGTQVVAGSFLDWIDADLRANAVGDSDLPFDFVLGWVGYLGYELKAECGAARAHRSTHPDAAMVFADRIICFDHTDSSIHLLALVEEAKEQQAESWLAETGSVLAALAAGTEPPAPVPFKSARVGPLDARFDDPAYLALISACQDLISAGETYEVCLTNMVTADTEPDAWSTYRRLRDQNPAPFGALLRLGPLSVLGSSPERFLRVDAGGGAESKPIKGTRPRGASPVEDEQLRRELGSSEKDRAENLMIVDLVRHDLGACAEVGSVRVDKLFDVETFATVHQLVSTVRAQLRADVSAVDCLRASFPGGSMTGAPKVRTMQIIDALEEGPRGVYSGALGYFSLTGAADLSMVIRTLVLSPGKAEFGVGGAIIALSDPESELEELAVKAAPILRLLQASPSSTAPLASEPRHAAPVVARSRPPR